MKYIFSCVCLIGWCVGVNAMAEDKCDAYIMGQCFSCRSPMAFEISSDEICQAICPERVVIPLWRHSVCALKECPPSAPYRIELTGDCRPTPQLSVNEEVEKVSRDEAENQKLYGIPAQNNKCPQDKPLLSKGVCYPCNYKYPVTTSYDNLKKCPNRIDIPYPWDEERTEAETYVVCPKDKPLYHWSGTCYPCDYPDVVPVLTQCLEDAAVCDVCPNRTLLPVTGGNRPSVLKCPKDKPLMDKNGICFDCDTELKIDVQMMEDTCEKACPSQRVLHGNLCVKK